MLREISSLAVRSPTDQLVASNILPTDMDICPNESQESQLSNRRRGRRTSNLFSPAETRSQSSSHVSSEAWDVNRTLNSSMDSGRVEGQLWDSPQSGSTRDQSLVDTPASIGNPAADPWSQQSLQRRYHDLQLEQHNASRPEEDRSNNN